MRETLGEPKAREIWADAGKVRRGRIKGKRIHADPAPLLDLYDRLSRHPTEAGRKREQIVRDIAEIVHDKARGHFGWTAQGIAATIKRALKDRERRDAELRARLATWAPFGLGGPVPLDPAAVRRSALAALLMAPDTKAGGLLSGEHE